MSVAGELIAALELPRLMARHCMKVAPELADTNARALQDWLGRNAALFDLAREEIRRAQRYLALPSTPKEAGLETVEQMLVILQAGVSAKLSASGPEAEYAFCRAFPEYLARIEAERTREIAGLLAWIDKNGSPDV